MGPSESESAWKHAWVAVDGERKILQRWEVATEDLPEADDSLVCHLSTPPGHHLQPPEQARRRTTTLCSIEMDTRKAADRGKRGQQAEKREFSRFPREMKDWEVSG